MGLLDDSSNLFGSNQMTGVDLLNNLLDPKDITMKTDLNMTQIGVLFKISLYYNLKKVLSDLNDEKIPKEDKYTVSLAMKDSTNYFMQLMVSLKRLSRKESVDGVSNLQPQMMQTENAIAGMLPRKK